MSAAELLVIFIVALIVFGPKKLPMLATHLGLLLGQFNKLKSHVMLLWQQQINEIQLQENLRRAKAADEQYKAEKSETKI